MRKFRICSVIFLSLLFLFSPSHEYTRVTLPYKSYIPDVCGAANIDKSNRCRNIPPGYCFWCCVQTICRQEHIIEGCDIVNSRMHDDDVVLPDGTVIGKNFANDKIACDKLNSLNIKYIFCPSGTNLSKTKNFIRESINANHPCIVIVTHGLPTTSECHAVIIVDWNDENGYYDYIDSNDVSSFFRGSIAWFNLQCNGFAMRINK